MSEDVDSPAGAGEPDAGGSGGGGADDVGSTSGRVDDSDEREAETGEHAAGENGDAAAKAETSLSGADQDLVARLAVEDEALAEDVESRLMELRGAVAEARTEAEDFETRLKRTAADFQNYKKRAKKRQEEERKRATESLVERLVDVRDNLTRALEDDNEDVEGLREGVKLTLNEFDRVLDAENVAAIVPEPGSEVDPERHEVMMRVDAETPTDTVAEVYQPGYEMAGKVLRPAKVTVSDDE